MKGESWRKWENYIPPAGELKQGVYAMWRRKHDLGVENGPVLGGSLRKNTPRNEKFGNSHRVAGVRVK